MGSRSSRLATVFVWINWFLSGLCILFWGLIFVFAFLKVDARWQDKITALLLLSMAVLFPAIFFFLNGLIIRSKTNEDQEVE